MTGDTEGALMLRAVENPLGWKTAGALLYARLGGGGLWEERSRTKQRAQEPSVTRLVPGGQLGSTWQEPFDRSQSSPLGHLPERSNA